MKICFIAVTPYPGFTFPELRNAAAELTKLGNAVTVIVSHQSDEALREVNQSISIIRIPVRNRWQIETFLWRAARIAKKMKPDIVHVFWRFGARVVPCIVGRRKCLLDIRTGSIDERQWRRRFENALLRLDCSFFRFAATLDEQLTKYLQIHVDGYIPEGIPQNILNNPDTNQRQEIRKEHGWHNDEIVGIYIGTAYLRHLDQLFEGWNSFRSKDTKIRLVVIGDAIRQKVLSNFVRTANNSITLHPNISPDKLWPLLRAADFGVAYVPKTPGFAYQQSTKILEYVAAGLPVLATNTPTNMHFIIDGKTIYGFTEHLWNGMTTKWLAQCIDWIFANRDQFPDYGLFHIFGSDVSKYDMVTAIAKSAI